ASEVSAPVQDSGVSTAEPGTCREEAWTCLVNHWMSRAGLLLADPGSISVAADAVITTAGQARHISVLSTVLSPPYYRG
ncbi:hypothetical protein JMJ77_0001051, partial [Colletotrichum scovillei]